jgi:ABC-type sugar transport system substrate-binding protein
MGATLVNRRLLEIESGSVLIATIALIVFIGILHPDFLDIGQLKEVVQNATYVGIIAAGMAFLIIMIGTDTPGLPVLEQRNQGFMDVIKKERPGVKFIVFDAKQSPTDNFNTWSAQVKAHPDAIAYVGPGSQAAVSLSRIQRASGQKLLVGACDLDKVAMQGVKDGLVKALISPEHWLKGYLGIKLMADAKLEGKELPEGMWNSGALEVNSDNIDEILARQENAQSRSDYFKDEVDKQLSNPDQYLGPMPGA